MGKILENLNFTLALGLIAAIALMMGFHAETLNLPVVLRWLHVVAGILWIGLLYYFNFVQVPFFGDLPVIGWLFKNHASTAAKTELLIFITPRIIKS